MVSNVYNDRRLCGDGLVVPFRAYTTELLKTCDTIEANASVCERVGEIFKRIVLIIALPVALPFTAVVLSVGMAVKYLDLARRTDELYSQRAMITSQLPFFLEMYSRLGDRLLAYMHAKYLGQEHGLPLYYKPFSGDRMFNLRQKEMDLGSTIHDPQAPLYFKRTVYLETNQDLEQLDHIDPNESVLYVLPFSSASKIERGPGYQGITRDVNWEDPVIKAQNKVLLEVNNPDNDIPFLELPDDAYAIAVHIRTGGDFDNPDMATLFPARLPTREFYYEELSRVIQQQINRVSENDSLEKRNIFVHIFTDALNVEELKNEIEAALEERGMIAQLADKNIQFTLSFRENAPLRDDFANMSKPFDCFIRPDSNLSRTVCLYNDFPLEICPSHFRIESDWSQIIIDQVEWIERDPEGIKVSRYEDTAYHMDVVRRCYLPLEFYKWWHSTSAAN